MCSVAELMYRMNVKVMKNYLICTNIYMHLKYVFIIYGHEISLRDSQF